MVQTPETEVATSLCVRSSATPGNLDGAIRRHKGHRVGALKVHDQSGFCCGPHFIERYFRR